MRRFCINCTSVFAVTIDENVTAIEGYGLGLTCTRITEKNYEGMLRRREAIFFCIVVRYKLGIRADILALFGVLQVELMTEDGDALIGGIRRANFFCTQISALSGERVRECAGTLPS